jgi:hypothetical protein
MDIHHNQKLEQRLLITTEPPRLTSITLVRRYPAEDVRRTQFLFEDEFKTLIGGQTTSLSTPVSPPDAPRFMMTDGKRSLVVSNSATQLSLDFGETLPPKLTLKGALSRPASMMDEALGRIFHKQTTYYAAIIVVWAASQWDMYRLSEELVQWTMKAHFAPQLAAFGATIGVERDKISRTIEVSQYKSWKRVASAIIGGSVISVDPDFEAAEDQGLQIKIDVNTKPQIKNPPGKAFVGLIPSISDTISVELQNLIGPQLATSLPQ